MWLFRGSISARRFNTHTSSAQQSANLIVAKCSSDHPFGLIIGNYLSRDGRGCLNEGGGPVVCRQQRLDLASQ
jgi:hypothetical protein